MPLAFNTDAPLVDRGWRRALAGLERDIIEVAGKRVITCGPGYPGIWLEHAALEGLLYGDIDAGVGKANHTIFLDLQKADGQLPFNHLQEHHNRSADVPRVGYGQVQAVVSLILTGYELVQRTGDLAFAAQLYEAGERLDGWYARYRDSEGLGLVQAFCVYDTGHDNSWRFGRPPDVVPVKCPGGDARNCNEGHDLPWYAPDMSAVRVEMRQGLSGLARMLGREADARRWETAAQASAQALMSYLYDAGDAFFYDRDCHGQFRRFRTEAALHPLRARVLPQREFARMWAAHLGNPARFWTHTPFPSVAVDDPAFDAELPLNCWSGASQALTVERAPRWMERYGQYAALAQLLGHWRDLLANAKEFGQEANPFTGEMRPEPATNYSASLFVMLEAIQRLHGIHRYEDGLAWNCRIPPAGTRCDYTLQARDIGAARLIQENGRATLVLDEREIATLSGVCRVRTDRAGMPIAIDGTSDRTETVTVNGQTLTVAPDTTQWL